MFDEEEGAARAYNAKIAELGLSYCRATNADIDGVLQPKPQTSSQYRGVTWDKTQGKPQGKWKVQVTAGEVGLKKETLCRYDEEISAAKAYDRFLREATPSSFAAKANFSGIDPPSEAAIRDYNAMSAPAKVAKAKRVVASVRTRRSGVETARQEEGGSKPGAKPGAKPAKPAAAKGSKRKSAPAPSSSCLACNMPDAAGDMTACEDCQGWAHFTCARRGALLPPRRSVALPRLRGGDGRRRRATCPRRAAAPPAVALEVDLADPLVAKLSGFWVDAPEVEAMKKRRNELLSSLPKVPDPHSGLRDR
ncbi:phosphatidylinositol kinase [Aureococcus anophagefferens]|nr:phosphatidylinositol kinase [Aureococcus anophagefferens]